MGEITLTTGWNGLENTSWRFLSKSWMADLVGVEVGDFWNCGVDGGGHSPPASSMVSWIKIILVGKWVFFCGNSCFYPVLHRLGHRLTASAAAAAAGTLKQHNLYSNSIVKKMLGRCFPLFSLYQQQLRVDLGQVGSELKQHLRVEFKKLK